MLTFEDGFNIHCKLIFVNKNLTINVKKYSQIVAHKMRVYNSYLHNKSDKI